VKHDRPKLKYKIGHARVNPYFELLNDVFECSLGPLTVRK
jgi:hypothetical protein